MIELVVEANVDKLGDVIDFVNEKLEAASCPVKTKRQIDISVEEIFVNIANYAYGEDGGDAVLQMEFTDSPKVVSITFLDGGVPYNPLEKEDPDTSLSLEERAVGGLGIFMTKNLMDDMFYEYKDGKNILNMKKTIPQD